MYKRLISSVLISCALSLGLFAQTVQSSEEKLTPPERQVHNLTIEDAVSLAIQNNNSIKQSKLQLDLLEKQDKYSWNSVSPSLKLSGGLTDNLPRTTNQSGATVTENTMSYSVGASVSVNLSPSLYTSIKAAEIAFESGEISYETAVRTVEMNVRQTFYSLLNMKETIESSQLTLDSAKRTYESNLEKYNRGQLDQLTLLTSQYNYEKQVPSVESAKYNYQSSLDSLKQVLGINLSDEVILEGSLDDILNVKLDENLKKQNLDEIPSVKSVLQSIKSTENNLLATKFSAWGPTLSLGYSYGGGGGISPSKDYASSANTITLNVAIPLDGYLPWSNGAMSIETQKSNLEQYKIQLDDARTSAMISIRNSYNTIENAQNQLKTYESNLELMQKTYDMTLIAYNNGSKDLSALETAQDNLSSARFSLQNQKYTIINAVLNLENTLGVPFGTLSKGSDAQ